MMGWMDGGLMDGGWINDGGGGAAPGGCQVRDRGSGTATSRIQGPVRLHMAPKLGGRSNAGEEDGKVEGKV
jgi:hypothetical protein